MTGKTLKKLVSFLVFAALAWAGGFAFFLASLPKPDAARPPAADGIVVYTGGGGVRISYGMGLLADGAGQRLLISGVHPDTSAARLSEFWVGPRDRFDCCVDLGREALTTEGNADELKSWAETHRYKRVILVTSDYHMPRAIAVTQARMKGVDITPYAVSSGYIGENGLPSSPRALGKLAGEYTKYLLARVKALIPSNGR